MKVSHFSVKHPAIITILIISLAVFASFSFIDLNMEFINDISLPSVLVVTIYPGAGAKDVETEVTEVMEKEFITMPGYKKMESTTQNSISVVRVEYKDGIDPHSKVEEMRYRITQLLKDLPENILGQPIVMVGGAEMLPIMTIAVDGGHDVAALTKYIDDNVQPRLSQINGVSKVKVVGGKELEVQINLDLDKLVAMKISIVNIYKLLKASSVQLPVGNATYKDHTLDIRYVGTFDNLNDMKKLPIGFDKETKTIIRLSDVATIKMAPKKADYYVNDKDKESINIAITKRSDGNVITIIDEVKSVLENTTRKTKGAIKFKILSDDSNSTKIAINTVVNSGILGLIMAIIVIAIFLGDIRATLIVGLSIPLSILFTLIGIKLSGMSINLLTVSGLVVALGMIVDGSIVMLEQVYQFYNKRNMSLNSCIFNGADQVGGSIFASVLTTVVVFVPILFLKGIIGSILHDPALTIIIALSASFIAAVVITPFLMKLILREKKVDKKERLFDKGFNRFTNAYKKALEWSLKNILFIVILSVSLLAVVLLMVKALGFTFLPSSDTGEMFVELEFPQGYSLEDSRDKSVKALNLIYDNIKEVEIGTVITGSAGAMSLGHPPTKSYSQIITSKKVNRDRSIFDIMLDVEIVLSSELIDTQVVVKNGGIDSLLAHVTGGGGYAITLQSDDARLLYDKAKDIQNLLKSDPSVISATINSNFEAATLNMDMSHEFMSNVGVTSFEAGVTSLILFKGMKAGTYKDDNNDETYDINLKSNISDTPITNDTLSKVQVHSRSGKTINFASIGKIKTQQNISQINHANRANTITVNAMLVSEDAAPIVAKVNQYLKENPLPSDVKRESGGVISLIEESLPRLLKALSIAWFLVYVVMVVQFEKFRQPLIIMAAIPFCLIGVIIGLIAFGTTINIISVFGLISLGGIVVNNAIILIDNFNLRRNETSYNDLDDLYRSVVLGASSRLRPILMTTLSTLFGVIPMCFATGSGSELSAPLGQAIAGGLISSTLISLFLVPVLYYSAEKRILIKKEKETTESINEENIKKDLVRRIKKHKKHSED